MSEQTPAEGQAQQATEVHVDDTGALPSYSNFCRVTATPEEVILDFGLNPQPFAQGRQDVKANQRIVMNFYTAKRLLTALGMTIQRHEGTFGLDRAGRPAAGDLHGRRRSPTPPAGPARRRRIIELAETQKDPRTAPRHPLRDERGFFVDRTCGIDQPRSWQAIANQST